MRCTHRRFEALDDVTTAPALAVGDKPSIATAQELRGETPSSLVSLPARHLSAAARTTRHFDTRGTTTKAIFHTNNHVHFKYITCSPRQTKGNLYPFSNYGSVNAWNHAFRCIFFINLYSSVEVPGSVCMETWLYSTRWGCLKSGDSSISAVQLRPSQKNQRFRHKTTLNMHSPQPKYNLHINKVMMPYRQNVMNHKFYTTLACAGLENLHQ